MKLAANWPPKKEKVECADKILQIPEAGWERVPARIERGARLERKRPRWHFLLPRQSRNRDGRAVVNTLTTGNRPQRKKAPASKTLPSVGTGFGA